MNEIRFGDAVESDTIAQTLEAAIGWTVTLGLDGGEDEGRLTGTNREGLTLDDDLFYPWTDIMFVTIH